MPIETLSKGLRFILPYLKITLRKYLYSCLVDGNIEDPELDIYPPHIDHSDIIGDTEALLLYLSQNPNKQPRELNLLFSTYKHGFDFEEFQDTLQSYQGPMLVLLKSYRGEEERQVFSEYNDDIDSDIDSVIF